MAEITTIDQLNADDVLSIEDMLVEALRDQFPTLDFNPGRVLRDILIRPAAMFHALNRSNMDRLRRSMSLAEVEADATLADSDTVDNILSNFLLTRLPGDYATGAITVVISSNTITTVSVGTVFTTASGLEFITETTFNGVTSSSLVLTDNDRLIQSRSDGTYGFTIDVKAVAQGAATIKKDTRFISTPVVARMTDAFAESDFVGGASEESNAEAIARLKTGITAQVAGGRAQIETLLRQNFPEIIDVSIIGFGDPEMRRDKHNIFGVSNGGKADLYVRTRTTPLQTTLIKNATLIDATAKTWRLNFTRNEAPGFYRVENIVVSSDVGIVGGSLEIISDTRGFDITGLDPAPCIENSIEAEYSRYQTAEVIFSDPSGSTAGLIEGSSQREYAVTVSLMPSIDLIQDFLSDRGRRNPQADYLVRAPLPCFVSIEASVQHHPDSDAINAAVLQQAVADAVGSLRFADGRLAASIVVNAIQSILPSKSTFGLPLHLIGTLRLPGSSLVQAHDTVSLLAPDTPESSCSTRTTAFYADASDISIEVVEVAVKDV